MKHWLKENFPQWFVFGGYSDPGFKHTPLYNPDAPCDIADDEGDIFTSIPYPVAEKLIEARSKYVDAIRQIAKEYPEIVSRLERRP